jgi:hypothetical protein
MVILENLKPSVVTSRSGLVVKHEAVETMMLVKEIILRYARQQDDYSTSEAAA